MTTDSMSRGFRFFRKTAAFAAFAFAGFAAQGVTYEYSASNPQTAYGDNVTITYNALDEIERIEVNPIVGEDIVFTGDEMTFCNSGPEIVLGAAPGAGELCFSNAVTTESNMLTITNTLPEKLNWTGDANAIPAQSTGNYLFLFEGLTIDMIRLDSTKLGGGALGNIVGELHYMNEVGDGIEVQLQNHGNGSSYVKCVKLYLFNVTGGVAAQIVYARNCLGDATGVDFDAIDPNPGGTLQPGYYNGYEIGTSAGITEIHCSVIGRPAVRFAGAFKVPGLDLEQVELTVCGAALDKWASQLYGKDNKLVFEGGSGSAEGSYDMVTAEGEVAPSAWTMLAPGQTLAGMTVVSSKVCGNGIIGNAPAKPNPEHYISHFTNDGVNASCWVQHQAGVNATLKSTKLEFRQVSGGVEWKAARTLPIVQNEAKYGQYYNYGSDLDALIEAGTFKASDPATGIYNGGYNVTEVALHFTHLPNKVITLFGSSDPSSCQMTGGEVCLTGRLSVNSGEDMSVKYSLPKQSTLKVCNGATFNQKYRGEGGNYFADGTITYEVHGGTLQVWEWYNINTSTARKMTIDGGEVVLNASVALLPTQLHQNYLTYVDFVNGGVMRGGFPRSGGGGDSCYRVYGEGCSVMDTYLQPLGRSAGSTKPVNIVFDVENTTGDDGVDFKLTRGLVEWTGDRGAIKIVKRGEGTFELAAADGNQAGSNGPLGITNPTTYSMEQGVLLLRDTDTLRSYNAVSIDGGTLEAAASTENEAGALSVTASGTIKVDAGARLVFADSSGATWADDTTLTIDLAGGTTLRFGTDANGLTSAQLRKLRPVSGGGRFSLDSSGYLQLEKAGAMLIFR